MRLDILLNGVLPIFIGAVLYFLELNHFDLFIVKNYFPDGLWAYSFISIILIIWDRRINYFWILVVFIFSIIFELLQYYHIINGTGDIWDIVTYFIFFAIAIMTNKFFKRILKKT